MSLSKELLAVSIEDNIPLPPTSKGPQNQTHPLGLLRVGESFHLSETVNHGNLSSTLSYWRKKTGFKFAARKRYQERDKESGFRVWRIE